MGVVSLFVITQVVYLCVSGHHDESPILESRKFVKHGVVTISGLFPVHVRSCDQADFRPDYLALSQAMVYAIERVNTDLALLPNITLGYEIYDYCLTDRLAMETALEIINRRKLALMYGRYSSSEMCFSKTRSLGQIPVMIGSGTSGSSILVANLLQVEDIPLISYAATSDELSKKTSYPTFIRTVPPDRFQSQAMADIAFHFNWTYLAAIAADDAYGRSGIDYFRKQISNKGTCLAMESYFLDGTNETKEKLSRIITELKALKNVEVVVLYCTRKQAKLLLEEAHRQNLPKKTWIASEGWANNQIVLQPSVVKGLIGIVYRNIVVEGFVQYLMNLTSAYRPVHWWENFWESEFDCVFKSNGSKSVKTCSDNLRISRKMYHSRMHTSMSAYVINAVYAIAHALDAMYRCKDPHGLFKGGKCPMDAADINPKDLLTYIKAVNFTSPVSQVRFDSNGDPTGAYTIINLQQRNGSWKFESIGSWVTSREPQLDIDSDMIMWNGDSKGEVPKSVCQDVCRPGYWQTRRVGCCWQCIECSLDEISQSYGSSNCSKCPQDTIPNPSRTQCKKVPLIYISYLHPFGLTFIGSSCVGLAATVYVAAVFIRYNHTPIVKAANRELSYMLLFCIAMCYLAPFIYLAEPTKVSCILEEIWFYMFYTTCIAILGAKTNKIVLLFEQRTPRAKYTSGLLQYRHVLFVVCAMILELIIITIWVFVDPPHPYINKSSRDEYLHTCKPSTYTTGEVCHYLLMSILILGSLFCCYFAYKARRLPDNFNEAKFIAFSIYILTISWLTFYPVFLNIQDIYTVVVLSVTTFVAASGLLVCMFWPKIYIIVWAPYKNTKQHMQEQITRHAFRVNTIPVHAREHRSHSIPRVFITTNTLERPYDVGQSMPRVSISTQL
ncbi:hypothetical protein QZH41_000094 [Actinostola sp. cb2023]|nr:hypothetical protein QZH41_000094 [Actinostola sp. cb2023]